MWWLIFATSIVGEPANPSASPSRATPITVTNSAEARVVGSLGTCEHNGRAYNLRRLMPLADRSVEIDGPNGPLQIVVDGEYLRIYAVEGQPQQALFTANIGAEADRHQNLDVELRLAVLSGELVVIGRKHISTGSIATASFAS